MDDYEKIDNDTYWSPTKGWITRKDNPGLFEQIENNTGSNLGSWGYYPATGNWGGGYVRNGVPVTDSQWEQIPAALRAQFNNDINALNFGTTPEGIPSGYGLVDLLSPRAMPGDWNKVKYIPGVGLTTELSNMPNRTDTSFDPGGLVMGGLTSMFGGAGLGIGPLGSAGTLSSGIGGALDALEMGLSSPTTIGGTAGATGAGAATTNMLGEMNNLGLPTDVTSGGIPPVSSTGTDLINAATGTTGGVSGAMGAGQAVGAGAVPAATSWWDTIADSLGLSPGAKNVLGTVGSALGLDQGGKGMLNSILEYFQSGKNADLIKQQLEAAANRGDPAAGERAFYQNLLRQSYTNPNFLATDPTFAGMRDVAVNDARKLAAARGYGDSSNLLYDIADRIQKQGANYLGQWQGQVAQNAGFGISPGTSAQIQAQGANQIAQAQSKESGALGNVLSNIPNVLKTISQGLV